MLVSDVEDLTRTGAYCLGCIHCLHPQKSKGKDIVRCATVAVIARNALAADSFKVEYIAKDLSKIAPGQILFRYVLKFLKRLCFYCVCDFMLNILENLINYSNWFIYCCHSEILVLICTWTLETKVTKVISKFIIVGLQRSHYLLRSVDLFIY